MTTPVAALLAKAKDRSALCGVVGLGYVGLPLVMEFVRAGYTVIGFDVSKGVVDLLNAGRSHIKDVSAAAVAAAVKSGKFVATTDLPRLRSEEHTSELQSPLNISYAVFCPSTAAMLDAIGRASCRERVSLNV